MAKPKAFANAANPEAQTPVEELPLTVAGLRALLGEVLVEALAARKGRCPEPDVDDMIAYCEQRLPAVFSIDALTRGPAVGAVEDAIERGLEAEDTAGGMMFPPDPDFLKEQVDEMLGPVLEAFSLLGVVIPGSVEYVEKKRAGRRRQSLFIVVDDNGQHQARTDWFEDPDTGEQVQLRLDRRGHQVHISLRKKDSRREWVPLSAYKLTYANQMAALWKWFIDTYRNQAL